MIAFVKEKILAKRKRRRGGGYEYYIKWVGYDDSANEWIPATSLNCPERLAEFRREEERVRKRTKRDKISSKKVQKRINRTQQRKKRRTKMIQDDDDEEEGGQDEDPPKSVASSTNSEKPSKIDTTTYGLEKGFKVQAVLGINRNKGEQLHYLVHYESPTSIEDNMELIPADVAKKYCEDEIIQFYETRISWNDRQNERSLTRGEEKTAASVLNHP